MQRKKPQEQRPVHLKMGNRQSKQLAKQQTQRSAKRMLAKQNKQQLKLAKHQRMAQLVQFHQTKFDQCLAQPSNTKGYVHGCM